MDRSNSRHNQAFTLEENLGGATVELTTEDVHSLEEASSAIKVEGERYPATHAKLIDR